MWQRPARERATEKTLIHPPSPLRGLTDAYGTDILADAVTLLMDDPQMRQHCFVLL